jgi:hypothetical protein
MLLQGVREVAAIANPNEPEAVTQRNFDAKRERSTAHAALPPARRITERLKLSWAEVLAIAHAPEAQQNKLLGAKDKSLWATDWLTNEHVAAVLGLAAARLGADTVSVTEYDAERRKLVAADHARWLHGRHLLLPTPKQIVHKTGSWDEALRIAALKVPNKRAPRPREKRAPPLMDLIERFHDHYGVQPHATDLIAFAKGNGIPYPDPRKNKFSVARTEWLAKRRAQGLPDPKRALRPPGRRPKGSSPAPCPDYSRDVGAALPGERRLGEHRLSKWSREDCIASVASYLASLGGREHSTLRGYTTWAAAQESAPVIATVELHGSWETMRKLAQEELLRRAASD